MVFCKIIIALSKVRSQGGQIHRTRELSRRFRFIFIFISIFQFYSDLHQNDQVGGHCHNYLKMLGCKNRVFKWLKFLCRAHTFAMSRRFIGMKPAAVTTI
jgi:hypothetical protein